MGSQTAGRSSTGQLNFQTPRSLYLTVYKIERVTYIYIARNEYTINYYIYISTIRSNRLLQKRDNAIERREKRRGGGREKLPVGNHRNFYPAWLNFFTTVYPSIFEYHLPLKLSSIFIIRV